MEKQEQQAGYVVTARKWRPTRFADVVGQEHVTQTLRNAVLSGRLHHAYIFNGPRGVGKTTTARVLAKSLSCQNQGADGEPCNQCPTCVEITSGRSLDVIEIDGASNNSVDDVRKLRENAKYPPVSGKYKMYIIDEVHMLSTSAFNALLKTLEEPPKHLLFVFATTEPHKVPATILSRCQRFDFRRMQIDDIVGHLRHISLNEKIEIDDESLTIIAKKGDGSMRDSQSIFDQVVSFCGTTIAYERVNEALNLIDQDFFFTLGKSIRQHNIAEILEISRIVFVRGYDLQECLNGFAEHLRNLLTVLATGDTRLIETSKAYLERYEREAAHFTQADLVQMMNIVLTTEQALRFAPQPRLRFEFALIQMAKMESAVEISTLLEELSALKKKIDSGTPILPAPVKTSAPTYSAPSITPKVAEPRVEEVENTKPEAESEKSGFENTKPEAESEKSRFENTKAEAEKDIVTNAPQKIPTREAIPDVVSASRLQAEWKAFLETDSLDKTTKRYFTTGLCNVVFNAGEIVLTGTNAVIGDAIGQKKQSISECLSEFFGGKVEVRISGGSERSTSLFDEFMPSVISKKGQSEPSKKTVEKVEFPTILETILAESPKKADNQKPPTKEAEDLHDLDRSIVELFGAVEIAIR